MQQIAGGETPDEATNRADTAILGLRLLEGIVVRGGAGAGDINQSQDITAGRRPTITLRSLGGTTAHVSDDVRVR